MVADLFRARVEQELEATRGRNNDANSRGCIG
jgi:hypothetical protein